MSELRRYRMIFRGNVQGVGFRWRAKMAAQSLGLTGWVKNEWDGSVCMEVQGSRDAIERMLAYIDSGSFIRIMDMEKTRLTPDTAEHGFRVNL